jgi:hypothetical protein
MQIMLANVDTQTPLATGQSHNSKLLAPIEFLREGVVAIKFEQEKFFDMLYDLTDAVSFHAGTLVY